MRDFYHSTGNWHVKVGEDSGTVMDEYREDLLTFAHDGRKVTVGKSQMARDAQHAVRQALARRVGRLQRQHGGNG